MSLLPPKFSQGTCPFKILTQYLSLNTSLCTLRHQIITLFLFSDEARRFRKILHQQLLAMCVTFHLQQTLLTSGSIFHVQKLSSQLKIHISVPQRNVQPSACSVTPISDLMSCTATKSHSYFAHSHATVFNESGPHKHLT
jgi:hypothetical protein